MPLTLAKQNGPVCFKYAGVAALRLAPLLSTFKEQHVFAAASTVIREPGGQHSLYSPREGRAVLVERGRGGGEGWMGWRGVEDLLREEKGKNVGKRREREETYNHPQTAIFTHFTPLWICMHAWRGKRKGAIWVFYTGHLCIIPCCSLTCVRTPLPLIQHSACAAVCLHFTADTEQGGRSAGRHREVNAAQTRRELYSIISRPCCHWIKWRFGMHYRC